MQSRLSAHCRTSLAYRSLRRDLTRSGVALLARPPIRDEYSLRPSPTWYIHHRIHLLSHRPRHRIAVTGLRSLRCSSVSSVDITRYRLQMCSAEAWRGVRASIVLARVPDFPEEADSMSVCLRRSLHQQPARIAPQRNAIL